MLFLLKSANSHRILPGQALLNRNVPKKKKSNKIKKKLITTKLVRND